MVSCHPDYAILTSGACIVLVLGLIFFAAYLFSPRYGLLLKLRRARHFHEEDRKSVV